MFESLAKIKRNNGKTDRIELCTSILRLIDVQSFTGSNTKLFFKHGRLLLVWNVLPEVVTHCHIWLDANSSVSCRPSSAPLAVTWVNVSTAPPPAAPWQRQVRTFAAFCWHSFDRGSISSLTNLSSPGKRYSLSEGMWSVLLRTSRDREHLWLVETVAVMRSSPVNEEEKKK